jgi:hypothetical protein
MKNCILLPKYFFGDVASVLGANPDILLQFLRTNQVSNVTLIDENQVTDEEKARLRINLSVVVALACFRNLYTDHILFEVLNFWLDPNLTTFVLPLDTIDSFISQFIARPGSNWYKVRNWDLNRFHKIPNEDGNLSLVPTDKHFSSIFSVSVHKYNRGAVRVPGYSVFVPSEILEFNASNFVEETATIIQMLSYLARCNKIFLKYTWNVPVIEAETKILGDFEEARDWWLYTLLTACTNLDAQEINFYQQYLILKGFKFA